MGFRLLPVGFYGASEAGRSPLASPVGVYPQARNAGHGAACIDHCGATASVNRGLGEDVPVHTVPERDRRLDRTHAYEGNQSLGCKCGFRIIAITVLIEALSVRRLLHLLVAASSTKFAARLTGAHCDAEICLNLEQ